MKLVLLLGMDGTGELFEEFLSYHDGEHLVISLSQKGPQDYSSLAHSKENQLPKEDYILQAKPKESSQEVAKAAVLIKSNQGGS